MIFRLWDKQADRWILGAEGEDYTLEVYADGSFGVAVQKIIQGHSRWVSERSEYYELYMKVMVE